MTEGQTQKEGGGTIYWSSEWAEQVSIYMQGRSNQSNELQSYRLLFTALATIFLTVALTVGSGHWWGVLSGFVALFLAVLWYITCGKISEWIDDWDAVLAELWRKAETDFPAKMRAKFILDNYARAEPTVEFRDKGKCKIWNKIPYPPIHRKIGPYRLIFNLLLPFFVFVVSVVAIVNCLLLCGN